MKNQRITLKKLSTEALNKADSFYHSKDFKDIQKGYFNYLYTSSLQYLDTGDKNVLNRIMVAAGSAGKVRMSTQLLSLVACHKIVASKYSGKANTKRLTMRRKQSGELKEKMEAIINRDLDKKAANAVTFNVDQTETRAVNALAALLAHHVDIDVPKLVKLAQEKASKVALKETVTNTDGTVKAIAEEIGF